MRVVVMDAMRRMSVLSMLALPWLWASPARSADPTALQPVAATGVQSKDQRFSSLNDERRKALESMLAEEVQRRIDRIERIEGQQPAVTVNARLDVVKSVVVLDFSRGFLPRENGPAWENLTQEIDNFVYGLIGESYRFSGTRFLIEGRSILDY